ncbi:MAG: isocitrate/isopropylmalate dehydrogenase family protein [Clostridia bacterium]|nr:isocitrate/isopropylmalate dehydrogenase family protein [Clostridia bacterium]
MEKYIEAATEHFKKLLCEQLERASKLENAAKRKDFSRQNKIVIGVCYGDGIGPIICREAEALLFELLKNEIANGKIELKTIEGLTIENRLKCGQPIPSDVLTEIKSCDVLLKGPTTTPNGGTMESANVSLRRELDLYANLRPISIPEKNIDWAFFRENTEGEYTLGSKGIEIPEKLAMDFKVTTDAGTKRIARAAFEYARENGKKRVSIVTKANIMKKTDGKFSKICHEIASEYPDILCDEWYIDIMCANLVNESIRSDFEVILLPNLYGDIITDEAAQIQGGVGTAGSANIGDEYAMFEAIHGSAPRMIEEGIGEYANPSSIFVACQMLLRHIGMQKSAEKLERAMQICTETEKKVIVTGNRDGATCKEFANYVIETVRAL